MEGTKYIIRKGQHDAEPRIEGLTFTGDKMRFRVKFDRSAMYNLGDAHQQADWNKLQGFSDCSHHHHKDSARIVWRWYEDKLQLGAYTYCNEENTMQYLADVEFREWIYCSIAKSGDKYHISINGVCFDSPRNDCADATSYYLGFYFGGNSPAPHRINVRIHDIN